MLNRRILRAKVLQTLYSFEIAKEASYGLALDYIQDTLAPDWIEKTLTTPEQVVKEVATTQENFKIALQNYAAFEQAPLEPKIRKIAQDAVLLYKNLCQEEEKLALERLKDEINTVQRLYLKSLLIPQEIIQIIKEDQERYQQKINREGTSELRGDFKLSRNPLPQLLLANTEIENQLIRHNLNWEAEQSQLRKAYRNFFEQDTHYLAYDQQPTSTPEEDKEMMLYLVRQVAFRQVVMNQYEVSEIKLQPEAWQEIFSKYSFNDFWDILKEKSLTALGSFYDFLQLKTTQEQLRKVRQDIQKRTLLIVNKLRAELRDQTFSETLRKYRKIKSAENTSSSNAFNENHFLIEQSLLQWIKESVNMLSQVLHENGLNHNDNQKNILLAFDKSLFQLLDLVGLAAFSSNQITVQILAEKNGSLLTEYFEREDINWEENQKTVQSLVLKTLKHTAEGQDKLLQELSTNWQDDYDFYIDLFKQSLKNEPLALAQIEKKSKNWEISRLPITDKIILKMAVAEMIYFYSIPVKVTINEYIDLAKQVSTPKSKQFINGMLESISKELLDKQIIKKSGRGLIANS